MATDLEAVPPLDKARDAMAAVEKAEDMARRVASYAEMPARRNVYLAAINVVGPLLAEHERLADRVAKLEGALREIAAPFEPDFPRPEHIAKLGDDAPWRSMAFEQADIAARALLTPAEGAEDGR